LGGKDFFLSLSYSILPDMEGEKRRESGGGKG